MVSPRATSALASLRPDIKDALTEFDLFLNRQKMVGLTVMPVIEVEMQAGSFPVIKKSSLLANAETARASGGSYNQIGFEFEDATFATKENGLAMPIDERKRAMFSQFGLEMMYAEIVRDVVERNQEKRIADMIFNTSTFTPTAVTNEWDDADNATPIDDVEARVQVMMDRGVFANALIINEKVFRNLRNCQQIIDRIASSGAGDATKARDITTNMLAQCFDLDKIIVAGAMTKTSADGAATFTGGPIWSGEYAAVCRVADPGDPITNPCVGRVFHWGGDGSSIDGTFETWYENMVRGDMVRYRKETQERLMYSDCVELLSNITT